MSDQSQEPSHLYATYLEMVHDGGDNRRRVQWVILPQMPARLAPGDSPITNHLVYFSREQRTPRHRAVWQFKRDTSGTFTRNLTEQIASHEFAGWHLTIPDTLLTCEIHPTELAEILKQPKTPYRILKRFEKVARSMYSLDIT